MIDINSTLQNLFSSAGYPVQPGQARISTKYESFDPNLLAEAQNTFKGGSHAQGSPQGNPQGPSEPANTKSNPSKKGTAGAMIPPGWSSQSK